MCIYIVCRVEWRVFGIKYQAVEVAGEEVLAEVDPTNLDMKQWLQRHPEAGSSWPSWPRASQA